MPLASCYRRLDDLDRCLEILTETENYMVKNGVKNYVGFNLSFSLPHVYLTAAEQTVEGKKEEWLWKARHASKEAVEVNKTIPL